MNPQLINGRVYVTKEELKAHPRATFHRGYWIVETELNYAVYSDDGEYQGATYEPVDRIDRLIKATKALQTLE